MNQRLLYSILLGLCSPLLMAQNALHLSEPLFQFPLNWQGDTANWAFGPSQGTGDPLYLLGPISLTDSIEVLFEVNPAFATSSNNYLELQLYSDYPSQADSFTGYLVRIGHTPDEISFFQQQGLSSTKQIDGVDKRISSSSNNRLEIRLKKSQNNWRLETRLAGEPSWLTEGFWADTSLLNIKGLGIYFRYSSSNASKLHFHQLHLDYPFHDLTPPKLNSLEYWSANACLVHFDELPKLDHTLQVSIEGTQAKGLWEKYGAQSALFYLDSASWPSSVFKLKIQGMQDESGNVGQTWDSTLYFRTSPDSIVFSEIQYDPSPTSPWPNAEYVEIWNTGSLTVRLDSFLFAEIDSFYFPVNSLMFPDSRLVLCRHEDSRFFDTISHVAFPFRKGFLSNAGERLLLANRNRQILDSLSYDPAWHDQNVHDSKSLEIKQKNATCFQIEERWGSCIASEGGSPGIVNSIAQTLIDSSAPSLIGFSLSDSLIVLEFSEEIHRPGSLYLNQSELSTLASFPAQHVYYPVLPKLQSNAHKTYLLQVDSFADCSGNLIGDTAWHFRYALPRQAELGDIHITEIHFRPLNGQQAFIELHNTSTEVIQLNTLEMEYKNRRYNLPEYLLYPDELIVLYKSSNWQTMPSLSTVSGDLALFCTGHSFPLDYLYFDQAQLHDPAKQAGGFSLEKRSPDGCFNAETWEASKVYGGSPGFYYPSLALKSLSMPELLHVYPLDSSLRLSFSEEFNPASLSKAYLHYAGLVWPVKGLNSFQLEPFRVDLQLGTKIPKQGELQLEDLESCTGEEFAVLNEVSLTGKLGKIYMNELYFHPQDGETDYLELYNAGDSAIDLKNTLLSSLQSDGTVKDQVRLFPEGFILKAKSYLLLSPELDWIMVRFPETSILILVQTALPHFNSDEGIVVLHDSLGKLLDSISYSAQQHAVAIQNPKGVALEKVDESLPSARSIWTSASSSSAYGTPGKRNSQWRGKQGMEDTWALESRRMSPDLDGYEDLLLIRYQNTESQARVVIHITDFSGNLIATLAEGDWLGSTGTYSWDGRTKDGKTVKPGAYCVFVQTYTDRGNKKRRLSFSVLSKH